MAFPSAARWLVSLGTIILTLSTAYGGGITPETIVRAIADLPRSTPLTLAKPGLTPISVTLTRQPTASPAATRTEIPSPTPEPERYRLSIAIVPDVSVEIALAPHPDSNGLYPQGTEVTVSLSATPPNVAFIRWEDYAQGDGVQMTVTVDRKLRIRALFTLRLNETPVPAPPPTTPSPPPVIATATKTPAPPTRTPARSQLATPIFLPHLCPCHRSRPGGHRRQVFPRQRPIRLHRPRRLKRAPSVGSTSPAIGKTPRQLFEMTWSTSAHKTMFSTPYRWPKRRSFSHMIPTALSPVPPQSPTT